jgi:hypothetical protein
LKKKRNNPFLPVNRQAVYLSFLHIQQIEKIKKGVPKWSEAEFWQCAEGVKIPLRFRAPDFLT